MLCVFLIFKKFSESKLRNLNLCHSRSVCSIQHVCRGQYFTLPLSATPRFNNSWSRNHYSDLSLSTLSRYTASSTSPCHCPQHHASTPVDLVTNTQNSLSLSLSTLSRYTASSTSLCHCPQHHASTPVGLVTNTQNSLSLHLITLHCKQY